MSETKFTKGSWGVHVCGRDMEPMIANTEDGKPAFVFCERKVGAGDKIIADVYMRSSIDGRNLGYPSADNMEEMLANTHLIVAAPDMYRTLKGLLAALSCTGNAEDPGVLIAESEAREIIERLDVLVEGEA